MKNYFLKFGTDVKGVDCEIGVFYVELCPPDPTAVEEAFARGGYIVEFDILDAQGNPDNEAYNELSEDDESRIEWEALDLLGYVDP
jgi:hypothetical protein